MIRKPYAHSGHKKSKGKTSNKSAALKLCDILWSKVVRERDQHMCQACGRPGNQPHHIFSRRHMATRHDSCNGITLCYGCHNHKAHGNPEEFRDFILNRLGQQEFERLKVKAYANAHNADFAMTKISLEVELKLLADGVGIAPAPRMKVSRVGAA